MKKNTLIYGKPKKVAIPPTDNGFMKITYANLEQRLYVWEITPASIKAINDFTFDEIAITILTSGLYKFIDLLRKKHFQ